MKRKDLDQFKKQNQEELKKKIADLKVEAANLRIDLSMAKVKNVHSISQKRKDIAKLMTILNLILKRSNNISSLKSKTAVAQKEVKAKDPEGTREGVKVVAR